MLNVLILFFLREKRGAFINRFTLPLRLLSSLINIIFYYYAAKAFVPNEEVFANQNRWTLFQFVMIGELSLSLTIDSLVIYGQQLRQIITEGVFDALLVTRSGLLSPLLKMGLSALLMGLLTLGFELIILMTFFDFTFPWASVLKTLLLNLSFIPFFTSLGIFSAALLIIFKRGTTIMGTLAGSLGILSGAYFPIDVFPTWLIPLIEYLNPLQTLLKETRNILASGSSTLSYPLLCIIPFSLGIILFFIAKKTFQYSINYYKKRGEPILLGT